MLITNGFYRTHTCGELRATHVGQEIALAGWVAKVRNLGGVLFVDLRDRYGKTQVVVRPDAPVFAIAEGLKPESTVQVVGTVQARAPETVNSRMATGEIEIVAQDIVVFAKSETPPFGIGEGPEAKEELRLTHRYLDLRRPHMAEYLILRHKAALLAREYLSERNFLEIETPILAKSTPEGARDYLVPSRIHKGDFYALPQSPQSYKQLLMVSGLDRYFQIVRCFRDEDLRADRQPEFTQIDIEMSFIDREGVMGLAEGLICKMLSSLRGVEVPASIPRLTFAEAMSRYGSDKPDLRFGMELIDLSEELAKTQVSFLGYALQAGGKVNALPIPGGAAFSRKQIDEHTAQVKTYGLGGLAWLKRTADGWDGPIAKFLTEAEQASLAAKSGLTEGGLLYMAAGAFETTVSALGALRLTIAEQLKMIPADAFSLLWVTDFPLLEWSEDLNRFQAKHHPFTAPNPEDLHLLETEPAKVRALAYDIILNGMEIGGGSIRIHDAEIQKRMFSAIGIGAQEAQDKFGFLLEAFRYGPPPHGGIAFGFDRIVMLLAGTDAIRDVIAFPKTTSASGLLEGSPSPVDAAQLRELGIRLED